MKNTDLLQFLNDKVSAYNQPFFIAEDPVCIPHLFSRPADIEIAGFFAAIFAWGNRSTIINKSKELLALMDNAPHDFCVGHSDNDLKKLLSFKHRTFNATDLLYFVSFFKEHYSHHPSLQTAFSQWMNKGDVDVENGLDGFYRYFFSLPHVPGRTLKHIACPAKKSACKRINMFLRWMVRKDKKGVDFGLWNTIRPAQLVIPLDLHVARVAAGFKLLNRTQADWQAAKELTEVLRSFDPEDPCKYDFALFGLGVLEKF